MIVVLPVMVVMSLGTVMISQLATDGLRINLKDWRVSKVAVDLLLFSAEWCGPCKNAERAGVYKAVEEAGFPVTKIDVDTQREIANQYGITAMPTMIIRKDNVPVRRLIGVRDASTLLSELKLAEG